MIGADGSHGGAFRVGPHLPTRRPPSSESSQTQTPTAREQFFLLYVCVNMLPRNPAAAGVVPSDVVYTPPRDPRLKQHRCHPRTADFVSTLMRLELGAAPYRAGLLYRCLTSAVGSEPSEPFLLDPSEQALKQKLWVRKGGKEGSPPS